MSAPNAGITVISTRLKGGTFANGEIKTIANDAVHATRWCAFQGSPPLNPTWRQATKGAGNPGKFSPGVWMVMFKANKPVNFATSLLQVRVFAGFRTRVSVTYS